MGAVNGPDATASHGRPRARSAVVVAVDGGGSKTDAVALDPVTGQVRGRGQAGGSSHHFLGLPAAVAVIDAAVAEALRAAGDPPVAHAACYLTGLDLPAETDAMTAALRDLPWAPAGLIADNDVLALLRAGTDAPQAAVVVCGTGINGAALGCDGAVARVLSLGRISGDFGGGLGLAEEVLWHAARAEDGRGPSTALRAALLQWTGRATVAELSAAVHRGEARPAQWADRVPDLMALAARSDPVARSLVERQGEEIAALASALLTRAGLAGRPVPLVLGGGILAARDPILMAAFASAFEPHLPMVDVRVVAEPPVVGAAALALAQYAARSGPA